MKGLSLSIATTITITLSTITNAFSPSSPTINLDPLHLAPLSVPLLTQQKRSQLVNSSTTGVYEETLDLNTGKIEIGQSVPIGEGRYGHSAFYSPQLGGVVFLGGQLSSGSAQPPGSTFTNQVLFLNTTTGAEGGGLERLDEWEKVTQPTAWGALALASFPDNSTSVITLGGLTSNCSLPLLHSLTLSSSPSLLNSSFTPLLTLPSSSNTTNLPPRRRQASSISLFNTTTNTTDIYLFGGVADSWTCAPTVAGSQGGIVAYLGIDRFSLAARNASARAVGVEVESWAWSLGEGMGDVPVSDYTATVLGDGRRVLFVGGQSAQGGVRGLDEVLVFDSLTRGWTAVNTSVTNVNLSSVQAGLMGHTAVLPPSSDTIIIHGGLSTSSHSSNSTLSPSSAILLLNTTSWTWSTPSRSNSSMDGNQTAGPALAYHSATFISPLLSSFISNTTLPISNSRGTILYAFGLNSTTTSSSSNSTTTLSAELYGLDVETFEWEIVPTAGGGVVQLNAGRVRAVVNPKATETETDAGSTSSVMLQSTTSSVSSTKARATSPTTKISTTSRTTTTSVFLQTTTSPTTTFVNTDPAPHSSSTAPSSSSSSSTISSAGSSSTEAQSNSSNSSTEHQTSLLAGVGSAVALCAVIAVGALVVLRRRRRRDSSRGGVGRDTHYSRSSSRGMGRSASWAGVASRTFSWKRKGVRLVDTPVMEAREAGGARGAPLVSNLMFARRLPKGGRRLSLGSSIGGDGEDGLGSQEGSASVYSQDRSREGLDPFSDNNGVNSNHHLQPQSDELGQISRQSTSRYSHYSQPLPSSAHTHSSPTPSLRSVLSVPYLSTITRTIDDHGDLYTPDVRQEDGRFTALPQQHLSRARSLATAESVAHAHEEGPADVKRKRSLASLFSVISGGGNSVAGMTGEDVPAVPPIPPMPLDSEVEALRSPRPRTPLRVTNG
ncbi:hypothetical protein T439DRAFT_384690 [Meredithblackwellia eburnea MCA 4105]